MKFLTEQEYMELLEMLKVAFTKIDERFEKIDQRFLDLEQKMDTRFNKIEQRLDYHETWLNRIEQNMVQKKDFNTLIKILDNHQVITNSEANHFLIPAH